MPPSDHIQVKPFYGNEEYLVKPVFCIVVTGSCFVFNQFVCLICFEERAAPIPSTAPLQPSHKISRDKRVKILMGRYCFYCEYLSEYQTNNVLCVYVFLPYVLQLLIKTCVLNAKHFALIHSLNCQSKRELKSFSEDFG